MLVERVFGQARSRAERVRGRRSRTTKDLGRAAGVHKRHKRRNVNGRRGQYAPAARERVKFAPIRSHPLFRFGTRWLSLLALGAAIWMLMQLRSGLDFQMLEIDIDGAYYMNPSRIRSIAGIIGKQSFQVDPAEIEKNLEAHPEIASAEVVLQWPNQISIKVEERLPVLEWNDAGSSWLISSEGIAYLRRGSPPELNRVHSMDKVLRIGDPLEPVIDPTVVNATLQLKAIIGAGQDLFFDREHGLGFQDANGWMAYFGTDGDMEFKIRAYSNIVEALLQTRYPVSLVSVENLSAPYYR